jgi:hypothetical protein
LPHVVGFAAILVVAAFLTDIPFYILGPIWFIFFWFISEPVDGT